MKLITLVVAVIGLLLSMCGSVSAAHGGRKAVSTTTSAGRSHVSHPFRAPSMPKHAVSAHAKSGAVKHTSHASKPASKHASKPASKHASKPVKRFTSSRNKPFKVSRSRRSRDDDDDDDDDDD